LTKLGIFKSSYPKRQQPEPKMPKPTQLLAYLCLLTAILILTQQYIIHGTWFEIADIHHETFSIAFFSFGLGVLLGTAKKTGKP
jgi:hypothetical protein